MSKSMPPAALVASMTVRAPSSPCDALIGARARRSRSRCAARRRRRRRRRPRRSCADPRLGLAHVRGLEPRGLGGRGELAAELAEHEVLAAVLDQAEGGGIPERGRPAVAEDDLVALGQRGTARRAARARLPTRFFTGAWRCDVPSSSAPAVERASSCAGRTFEGPQPKRPSAGRRSLGESRCGMRSILESRAGLRLRPCDAPTSAWECRLAFAHPDARNYCHDRSDRHHRDVPAHHPRARGREHRSAARAHLGAPRALGSDGLADRRTHGARRPRRRLRRPHARTHRRRAPEGRRRDAQAPPRRAPPLAMSSVSTGPTCTKRPAAGST